MTAVGQSARQLGVEAGAMALSDADEAAAHDEPIVSCQYGPLVTEGGLGSGESCSSEDGEGDGKGQACQKQDFPGADEAHGG